MRYIRSKGIEIRRLGVLLSSRSERNGIMHPKGEIAAELKHG